MKVLIIHFRSAPAVDWQPPHRVTERVWVDSAGTDGVSLEMKKRRSLLEAMGHNVRICSAYEWAEFFLPELEFDSEETQRMMRNLFGHMEDFASEAELKKSFDLSVFALKRDLENVVRDFKPDILFVHNILCLPIHPVASVALTYLLQQTGLPCTAIHHDILSEGAYKFVPTCDFAKSILEEYFPPTMPNLAHWTINSRNKKALYDKCVEARIIHDTMDFDEKLDPESCARLRNDLRIRHDIKPHDIVLFVGARIVPNKQIEVAGYLTAKLQTLCGNFIDQKLYNGEVFSEQSRMVLVLAGRPEIAFLDYRDNLFKLFDDLRINWAYVGDIVRPLRSEREGFYALYPDMYTIADFVLYPTGWEGFGNQLLEAFAAGMPATVFEYPVFKEDIAPKGVQVISLGDVSHKNSEELIQIPDPILNRAAYEMINVLTCPEKYRSMTSNNIAVGKQHFSFDVLRVHLNDALDWAK